MGIKSTVLGFLLSIQFISSFGAVESTLRQADSLFQSQKYTEAFTVYKEIMDQGEATPSMLLKMAFIEDASGNYTDALYHLDLYYRSSADRHAVGKIEEIAKEYELSGYQYTDVHYFIALFEKYKIGLIILLSSISFLLLTYVFLKERKGERAYIAATFQLFTLILILITINLEAASQGIIVDDQTLLRLGPSAGAEPVEVLAKGHKVKIINRQEIWTKIAWNGEEVFIRSNRLKLI